MTEDFLHYLWEFRLFDNKQLKTSEGDTVHILKPGIHNTDSGPDFFDARVRIGKTLWAGNIEIHINASAWDEHSHHSDNAYNNVILHVVYNNNAPAKNASGRVIPTLSLQGRFPEKMYARYENFLQSRSWIPCEKLVADVDELVKKNWLDRLSVERLERKTAVVLHDLKNSGFDWKEVFYIHLAKYLGLKINAEPFALLAKSLPLRILEKHKNNLHQVEALLYGQSGLLTGDFKDKYPVSLKKEYDFLAHKYGLKSIEPHLWKFFRLRPHAFPGPRISILANLLCMPDFNFSKLMETGPANDLLNLFKVVASDYWLNHFHFDKPGLQGNRGLGAESAEKLVINAVIPILFIYGKQSGNNESQARALGLMNFMHKEKNNITGRWEKLGFRNENALDSQALLELKNEYCDKKKCLHCGVGNYLLQPDKN